MTVQTETIQIPVEMLDKASKQVGAITKSLGEIGENAKAAGKSAAFSFTEFNSAISVAQQGLQKLKQIYDFGKEGASIQRMGEASSEVFRQMGGDIDDAVASIKDASLGTISGYDAMAAASRAAMLNVSADAETLGSLMEIAAFRGRAMGVSTTQAFNDMVTGIGRASPLILDNLGIITKGWADEAAAAGKAYDAQFILNKVLEQGSAQLAEAGGLAEDTATQFERLEANIKDAGNELKIFAAEAISPVVEGFNEFYERQSAIEDQGVDAYTAHRMAMAGITVETNSAIEASEKFVDAYGSQKEAMQGVIEVSIMTEEELKALSEANQEYLDLIGSMSDEYTKYQEKLLEVSENEKLTAEERQIKMEEFTAEYELNSKRRILAMAEEQLAADGLTEQEMLALEQKGLQWGIYTEEAIAQMQSERAEIAQLVADINSIPSEKNVTINVQQIGGYEIGTKEYNRIAYAGRAGGGPVEAGTSYLVGEKGPELFTPSTGGNITPNNALDMSQVVDAIYAIRLDPDEIVRAFTTALQRAGVN